MTTARFMPNDPRQMTADDKAWFTQNAAYDFTFVFKPVGFMLTAKQENQLRVLFEGALKTLNYMVYTKPVALATRAMFADRTFFYDNTNPDGPDTLPSAVGTLLIMRGLNTNALKSKVFTVQLEQRSGNYTGTVGSPVFTPARDKFTAEDLAAGKRLDFKLPTDAAFDARLTIPLGPNLEALDDYDDYWMYDSNSLNNLYSTEPEHSFSRGFIYDLVVHELLHALLHWNHTGGEHETDLVYSYSGMIGQFLEMRSEERYILTDTKKIPSSLTAVETISAELTQEFGGHMPMACYNSSPFKFGFRKGTYNLYTMYMANQLQVPVYNPPLPAGILFLNYKNGPNAGDTKSIPANPYEGITWKLRYAGIK
ncbi:hypothetical protein [Chitinophaga sp.]|uniref:hypothetical protein n=1 Tax=Chitinophaga sp. TaxID=1869181 RepID=UPI002F93C7A4